MSDKPTNPTKHNNRSQQGPATNKRSQAFLFPSTLFVRLRQYLQPSNWLAFIRGRDKEARLEKELSLHLDLHIHDLIEQGYSPEDARRQARLAIGGPEQVKEMCRDERRTRWLADLLQDLRYAARILMKQPGFTMFAVLTLALGIGVNTAILSAVHGFVLRPLPVDKPDELLVPYWGKKIDANVWGQFSYPNYIDLRDNNKSFSGLCAWSDVSVGISSGESLGGGETERAEVGWGELVSGNYFDVLGVKPMLGRSFLPEEANRPNAYPVTVISYSLWQRRFKMDRGAVGKTIYLNGSSFTIVGVMPESFLGSKFYLHDAFWVPLMMSQKLSSRRADWETNRGYAVVNLFGRLKSGVMPAQAEADLNRIAGSLAQIYPKDDADTKIQVRTEVNGRYGEATKVLNYGGLLALFVSGLVLLLACANAANLMLSRAVTRAREIGIRLAIGAGRGRVIRQLLTESVLLSLLGGLLGGVLAYFGIKPIQATAPPVPYPLNLDFAPDAYVFKWMLAVALLTGLIFGLAPAVLASRSDLIAVIKGAETVQTGGHRRWTPRGALVVAQVTISIVVLICAGLFIRSLGKALKTDPGFRFDNMVTMMIDPSLVRYDARDASKRFFPELLRRINSEPGIRSAALVNEMPLMVEHLSCGPIVREGEIDPQANRGINVDYSLVTPKYFETMRTPLVQGRDFTDRDDAEAPEVAIVNQEFARRFYGGIDGAMGKRFRFEKGTPLMEIIGVAQDGLYRSLYEDHQPYIWVPVYQHPRLSMTLLVSVQSSAEIGAATENVRNEIARMDSRLPVIGIMAAEQNMSLAYWGPRVAAGMATTFGLLALVLATMGLYSVMTYAVSQRTREIGIRMAVGASLGDVLKLVMGQGMRMVLISTVLGLVGAFALTRLLASLLLGVGATDLITFAGVIGVLVAVTLLACYIPARRAARVDPLVALRHE